MLKLGIKTRGHLLILIISECTSEYGDDVCCGSDEENEGDIKDRAVKVGLQDVKDDVYRN